MQLADAAHSQPPAKPSLPTDVELRAQIDAELRAQAAEGRAKQQSQQAEGSSARQPQEAERALSLKPQHAQQAADRTATQPIGQVTLILLNRGWFADGLLLLTCAQKSSKVRQDREP